MDNAFLATALSFAVTGLTSLFKTAKLSTKQKNLIATGLSVVAGAASVLSSGNEVTAGNLASTAVAIYGASQIAYHFILSGTSLNKVLTNVTLFGSKSSDVEKVLEVAVAAEKAAKKVAKKPSSAKKTANSKRVTK